MRTFNEYVEEFVWKNGRLVDKDIKGRFAVSPPHPSSDDENYTIKVHPYFTLSDEEKGKIFKQVLSTVEDDIDMLNFFAGELRLVVGKDKVSEVSRKLEELGLECTSC